MILLIYDEGNRDDAGPVRNATVVQQQYVAQCRSERFWPEENQ
jgi:hypothetical protein